MSEASSDGAILIHGARQNNLKNLTLAIPLNQLVVVSGVSGSGKSSLVFDTLYAEGQRRYVETFSPYARQFLDRMDKPQVDRIDGIPPAIAIDQTNPVRTSRSTVGTMTELNDHVKLLFARAAELHCRGCGAKVARDTPESIYAALAERAKAAGDPRLLITFPVAVPKNFTEAEVEQLLQGQGYARIHARGDSLLEVVQDRLRMSSAGKTRVIEALEAALKIGQGKVNVHVGDESPLASGPIPSIGGGQRESASAWRYSSDLHCAECDIHYADPTPSLFSFNSPIGACDSCRGFGRVIGIDFGLIVPDESKTLREGAVRPWQTASFGECQDDLVKYAGKRGIALDTPFRKLTQAERKWVLEGEPEWKSWRTSWPGTWYGVRKFFDWLETKAYKMHIRVLLSKYRAYTPCPACEGARLKHDALLWRLGTKQDADKVFSTYKRFKPLGVAWSEDKLAELPGLTMHDLMLLPIERCRKFFDSLHLPAPLDQATDLLLTEIRARLSYLCQVGLAYLTLDRQSRTLSGGEVQRINLTTALGTSLVNTLFVLDEPSIGLHPRDMGRVIAVMHRLRDAGNSLVVVEHDPQIMFAADRILDMGPGPGERGGEVVSFGTPAELKASRSLTAEYLSGRRRADGGIASRPPQAGGPRIKLLGAAEHNLKNIDVTIPLARLVCVTGVSGSGKSTLVQDVLHAALLKTKGRPTETPGAHRALAGAELVEDVVMVNQSPIGRTTRSNPASYVGAFDAIRNLFARESMAAERGYTAGTFSFNSGNGRCPTCGGNGFEHVEMQFLSDVYLRCPDCNGRRFRAEVLEVKLAGKDGKQALSLADVLELTVAEALAFFADHAQVQAVLAHQVVAALAHQVVAALAPLADVGLEYLKLGQPVPTLSGGEAQRLKLAGHLLEANKGSPAAGGLARKGKLFLFDEPTTGLHFDDIAKLLSALRKLIVTGHSVVVIEHNLDVIRASDWIIDLGPEGGDAGGEIVCTGTPAEVRAHAASHTGKALREYDVALGQSAVEPHQLGVSERLPLQKALRAQNNSASDPAHQDSDSALSAATRLQGRIPASGAPAPPSGACIRIHNAREHNLHNVDVEIPRNQFTVITGVSGSGKSTLAFDILFAEGQRRYLESLNAYARQFVQPSSRPDVDAIFGIPPTVAIEQRTSRGGRKSTVATLTEIYHFLRLMYVKLGTQYCPDCNVAIEPQSFDAIAARVQKDYRGQRIGLLAPLVTSRKGYYTDLAKWAKGKGYDFLRVDGEFLPTAKWPRLDRFREHSIELPVADLRVTPANEGELREALARALDFGKGIVHVLGGLDRLADAARQQTKTGRIELALPQTIFSTKRACPSCARSFPELDPRLFSFNSKHGWCGSCLGTGVKISGYREPDYDKNRDVSREQEDRRLDNFLDEQEEGDEPCPACSGQRLSREALAVRYRGRSVADLVALPVTQLAQFFRRLALAGREAEIARDLVAELKSRLSFLDEVGLGYLALGRSAPTLSGGEAQRIRLAAQLGSNLRGVCYILDEPTIGLHPRDNRVLLTTLEKLQAKGNTLVVVEHDEDTIRRAAHVLDLGPGAGSRGGRVVAQGSAADLMAHPDSVTGQFLLHPLRHPLHPPRAVNTKTPALEILGADLHNLKIKRLRLPLARLCVITGVSGSGKSTLAREVLYANLSRLVAQTRLSPRKRAQVQLSGCHAMLGAEHIGRVLEVDQTPIGKTPRSCPATYVGFWDAIRKLFADTTEARMRGWSPSRFSFNTGEGRCPACEGQGVKRIAMSFLPDVKVLCEMCRGARFNPETLSVRFKQKSIGEILAMNVDEAVEFFSAHPSTHHALRLLQDVGLGYLTLGQQSPTLSGGEAQRIKLVTELSKVRIDAEGNAAARPGRAGAEGRTLYVLDEPTVGLHMADVERLIRVLHRLVDASNTVVVIEHNLDIIADADWIIDLGPEGGDTGGRISALGTPAMLARAPARSHTARVLAGFLPERGSGGPQKQ
ncbi:MAG: excinuclease ABC subunit UvrA [Betaproteobacteria bacterium]|nr:excinuclease ABC subunit UvrA [Betaproteobacteria bacterium]